MNNIVGVLFNAESEARSAMSYLSENTNINGTKIFQISLVKRTNGVLRLCDNFTSDELKGGGLTGGLVGGLIGVLTGPVGMLLGGAAGALLGKAGDEDKKDDSSALIEQAAQKLEEGDIALIALAEEEDEKILDHMLVKFDCYVVRYDAEVISKELEEAKKLEEEMARQAREALRNTEK